MPEIIGKHVVVAMSGGVDSSTVAALLVEQGYKVTGVMLRLWSDEGKEASNRCCTPDSVRAARRVAAMLGISFYVIDSQQVFHQKIVTYFLDGYRSGVTPNPCILCNRSIRWGLLLDHAITLGADFFATGHYARLKQDEAGIFHLYKGFDKLKDQSYVLSMLNQKQLARTILPLGEMTKPEVRQHAQRFNLPVADKKDSQDLCFLGGEDYRIFLQQYAPESMQPGNIVTTSGELIGEHTGLAAYTIGQRKNIGISNSEPYYVISKDMTKNRLVVGKKPELLVDKITIKDSNWITGSFPGNKFMADVMVRYRAKMQEAEIIVNNANDATIHFTDSARDVTQGQLAAIYQGDEVIGGGFIQ